MKVASVPVAAHVAVLATVAVLAVVVHSVAEFPVASAGLVTVAPTAAGVLDLNFLHLIDSLA